MAARSPSFTGPSPSGDNCPGAFTPGPDVAQLDRNLIALGYGQYLTISDDFTDATGYAVEQWQQASGLPVTGTVPLGQVQFAPGPLRVTSVAASPGATPQPGAAVLTATSPAPVVVAQLPVAQEYLVRVGDRVTVTLPDGVTTTTGVVIVRLLRRHRHRRHAHRRRLRGAAGKRRWRQPGTRSR